MWEYLQLSFKLLRVVHSLECVPPLCQLKSENLCLGCFTKNNLTWLGIFPYPTFLSSGSKFKKGFLCIRGLRLQQLCDQRNSWHCGLTWNSGKYANDKIPACRYVPGLVWNEYPVLHQKKKDQQQRQNRFLSAQFASAASTFHRMRNEQRGHSHGRGRIIHTGVKTALDIFGNVCFGQVYLKTAPPPPNDMITLQNCGCVYFLSFFQLLCLMDFLMSLWVPHMADLGFLQSSEGFTLRNHSKTVQFPQNVPIKSSPLRKASLTVTVRPRQTFTGRSRPPNDRREDSMIYAVSTR